MRLTLRTLLAYMDDILEPADSQAIGKKVEESEFAHGLMSRIREVTTKLRLSAPRVSGRGMGLDPNTVAEYLDNTLPPERVPDFERVCLESDMQLAEVAGCHQILTLVLGEPVEVKPASRQRMYQLLSGHGEAHVATHETPRAAADAPQPAMRRKLEVPDYLRESAAPQRGWWQLAAVGVLIGLALGAIYMAVQPGSETPLALAPSADAPQQPDGMVRTVPPGPEAGLPADDGGTAPTVAAEPVETEAPLSGPDREFPATAPDVETTAEAPAEEPPAEGPLAEGPLPESSGESAVTAPAPEAGPAPRFAPSGVDPSLTAETLTPADRSLDDVAPEDTAAASESSVSVDAGVPSAEAAPGDVAATEVPSEVAPADIRPAPAVERSGTPDVADRLAAPRQGIARYLSSQQVLLSRDSVREVWQRLAPQQVLYPGEVLLSLPTFRASVALNTGLTVELVGATRIDLEPADESGSSGVVLSFGRLVLINTGSAGQGLRLKAGDAQATLLFADTESTLAVEMLAEREEGTDPETVATPWALQLYGVSGKVQWLADASAPAGPTVAAPQAFVYRNGAWSAASVSEKLPEWVSAERLRPIEQKASQVVQESLTGERAVELCLRELVDDRKEEVRSLSVRCLGSMDDFDPFVATLSDPHQQAYWGEQVDALRDALARGSETAARVRAAFTTSRGRAAPELYRMLWGYSDEQLKAGEAESLVRALDHDDLAVRVVSFWNLKRIAGGRTFSYRPEDPPGKRQPHVLKWRQRYEAGLLEWPSGSSPRS